MKVFHQPSTLVVIIILTSCMAFIVAIRGSDWFAEFNTVTMTPATDSEPQLQPVFKESVTPQKLEIDLPGKRVLFPGIGWITVNKFWDIYYNNPQQLPAEIDYEILHQLEDVVASEIDQSEEAAEPNQSVAMDAELSAPAAITPVFDPAAILLNEQ